MWPRFIQSLAAFLNARPELYEVVCIGMEAPVPDARTVQIQRGPSGPRDLYDRSSGEDTLWIFCWEKAADNALPIEGYLALAALEEQVLDAIAQWNRDTVTIEGATWKLDLSEVNGDGDLFRPMVGSRMTLFVSWRKTS